MDIVAFLRESQRQYLFFHLFPDLLSSSRCLLAKEKRRPQGRRPEERERLGGRRNLSRAEEENKCVYECVGKGFCCRIKNNLALRRMSGEKCGLLSYCWLDFEIWRLFVALFVVILGFKN